MRISDWSSDVCSSDLTFSIRKNLGRRPSTKRRKSQSSVPCGFCVLCRLPAVLNDWHGGPPIRTSTSPGLIPVRARNSSSESVEMSSTIIIGSPSTRSATPLDRIHAHKEGTFSTQYRNLNLHFNHTSKHRPKAHKK